MSGHPAALMNVGPPWWYGVVGSASELKALHSDLERRGCLVRSLRGSAMRTLDALFDEIARGLSFPAYFGRNWDALDECLSDLSWLPASAYVVLIRDSREGLAEEPALQFKLFLKVLDRVASEWAGPVEAGEPWDRPAVPFHIVFHEAQGRAEQLVQRFEDVGFALELLSLETD